MTLTKLANKYHTDKQDHGYPAFYDKYLPKKINSLLEIGVAMGASALMWHDYYPDADIHLMDLFQDTDHVSMRWCRENFFVPHQGDQGSLISLAQITNSFDIIVDDGSHNAHHMLISFKHLFHNNLNTGGIYSIEDCHCNKNDFYYAGEVKTFEDTPLWMFMNYTQNGEITNPYFNEGEQETFKNLIKKVEILCDEKLILIWRV